MAFVRMSSAEVRKFRKALEERWGVRVSREYWFATSSSGKVFAVSKGVSSIDVSSLRVSSMGVYVADVSGAEMRLSFDGSMVLASDASKNVVVLSSEQRDAWMTGADVPMAGLDNGWMVVKSGSDVLGCGFLKDGVLKNYVPKERRIRLARATTPSIDVSE